MSDEERRRTFLSIDPSDLVLEIISIVVAIVLATGVGQLVSNYQTAARSREALGQVRQEILHDDQTLRNLQPLHSRIGAAFDSTVPGTLGQHLDYDRFARTFARVAPRGFHPFSDDDRLGTGAQLERTGGLAVRVARGARNALRGSRAAD